METLLKIIVLAPLFSAIVAGFFHRQIGDYAARILTTSVLFLIAFLSWIVFFQNVEPQSYVIMKWLHSGSLQADWVVRIDRLTQVMLVVVTSVSALVHLYSNGYMAHDDQFKEGESYRPRFFSYLSFFTFAMLMLVTSDNLLQMFFGWEGVGVASYLLIGFYYRKQSAGAAAMKAFIVNRIGDFGFALGIFGIYWVTGSIEFDVVFESGKLLAAISMPFLGMQINAAEALCFLLFVGAMGKSAQFILHTWLPDAMEGPTPVSALIHAATMVTAGVFLVCRMSPIFEYAPHVLIFVTFIGAFTAFFAASVGLVQNDIKRVIAYSTCSQLGYMFVAAGVGAYESAMYHLFTHAFFKAMLFLGAGSVIHAMHHEQDMRNYGGLRQKIPYTFYAMLLGTLAITGVGLPLISVWDVPIGFSGFLSKDTIIESAFAAGGTLGQFAFWTLVLAAAMTSFYSWRLMFLTFSGAPRGDQDTHDHAHESPRVMLIPLAILALGAVFAGMIWYLPFFGGHGEPEAWFNGAIYSANHHHIIHAAHDVPKWVKVAPFIAMSVGLGISLYFYIASPRTPAKFKAHFEGIYMFLLNKWRVDELYDFLFVEPVKRIGNFLWKRGDEAIVDGAINGIALKIIPNLTQRLARLQNGLIYTYALAMILGIGGVLLWLTIRFGGF